MRPSTRSWAGLGVVTVLVVPFFAGAASAQTASDFRISSTTSTGGPAFGSGPSIGLDFRSGVLQAAWADNGISAGGDLELASAAVAVSADGSVAVGPTVNVSRAAGNQFGASLSLDPTVAGRVLAVANDAGATPGILRARSVDGGATWATTTDATAQGFGIAAPQVACDGFGNCFLAFTDQTDPFNPQLRLSLSTDGGQSFSPLAIPNPPGFEPNVALAVGSGSVWLVFQHFDNAPRVKALAAPVSGRGAIGAFTLMSVPVSNSATRPDIAIGPGGEALVSTEHIPNGSPGFIEVNVDRDGLGPAAFGPPLTVTNVVGYPEVATPQVAWDRARNRAYLVYKDQLFGSQSRDVLLRFSEDTGGSWSAAIRVNANVFSVDRLIPNVAVEQSSGRVGVAWYDFRAGADAAQLFGRVFTSVARPAEPASPVNLRATPVSRSQIDLAWEDRSDNETGFEIRRFTGNPADPIVDIFRVGANVTAFSNTGLPEDTGGNYVVRAFNAAGFSTPSNTAAPTTLDTPPSAPTNLVAIGVSFQRIDLRWDPADDPDGYEIQQSLDGVAWTSLGRSASTATSAMLFGLQADTTYFFRVRAFNSGGDGPFSNIASARTERTVPTAPTGLTATGASNSRIDLAWNDSSPTETRFEIQRSTGGRAFKVVATAPENAVFFTDTRLKARTTYTYRIRACNELGCSPPSNEATATTLSR
jgi:Fibronectin type III domain